MSLRSRREDLKVEAAPAIHEGDLSCITLTSAVVGSGRQVLSFAIALMILLRLLLDVCQTTRAPAKQNVE